MSSLKMTFSLTSLILILALAFATTSVMADHGGPMVEITDAREDDPATADVDESKSFSAFKLKLVFSIVVDDVSTTDGVVEFVFKDKNGSIIDNATGLPSSAAKLELPNTSLTRTNGTTYAVEIDLSSGGSNALHNNVVSFDAVVPKGEATGNQTGAAGHGETNEMASLSFDAPPLFTGPVVITAVKDATDTDATDGQNWDVTFTFKGTSATAVGTAPFTNEQLTYLIALMNSDGSMYTGPAMVTLATGDGASSGQDWAYTGSITQPVGVTYLAVGLLERAAMASNVREAELPQAAPPADNTPPTFRSGASIDDIIVWAGHKFDDSGVLPKARDNEGDTIEYKIEDADGNDLPTGFELLADDSQDRFIEVRTAGMTAVMAKKAYSFIAVDDKMAESDPITFNITVLAPIKPTAPTMVMAMEEGAMEDNTMRTVNTNRVVVTWKAPEDTTETSHDPPIPFGAPVSGYAVTQTDADDMKVSYPPSDHPAIKKDATSYKTPVVTPNGMYGFEVVAENSVGSGAKSAVKQVLVADVPDAPTNLAAAKPTNGEIGSVRLSWILSSSDGGAPIQAHKIYHTRPDRDDPDIIDADANNYETVDNLVSGIHVFRVSAINGDGESEKSGHTDDFPVDIPSTADNQDPTFGDKTVANITATVDTAIVGRTLPAATDPDGDAITYSIDPDVADIGLEFNEETRFLSGTPDEATDGAATYTYTATDEDGGETSLNFTITVNAVEDPPPPPVSDDLDATYDPMTGVTKIETAAEAGTMIAANGFATIGSQSLPDLEEFFDIGGTIGLSNGDTTDDKNSRTVVISEILWGLDLGAPAMDQTKWQFIELYNTTGAAINLNGWTLTFKGGNVLDPIDIDQVSNRGITGWHVDTGDTGKSGRVTGTLATDATSAITAVDIVSMYRTINYEHVETEAAKATVNREELVKGIPGGNTKGSWKSSQRRSVYNRWIYDSKRAKHFKPSEILSASTVGHHKSLRINEIGNDAGGDNDWIEIHNYGTSERSLNHYTVSMVTAKGTDTKLFDFKDQDWKLPAGEYIVVSTRHPRNTDLATGKDFSITEDRDDDPDNDLNNKGAKHFFVVKPGWDLQDDGKFALILRHTHDKQGTDAALEDVVATRQGAFADTNTSLWPLKLGGLPGGDVIAGGDENFAAGKVYQRDKGDGRGDGNFAVRVFTGVGYDRAAEDSAANGGTPGYDNTAVKDRIENDKSESVFNGKITFSEIMLDTGPGNQKLPQWIELYNSSMTQAINLNGWKLRIENDADDKNIRTRVDAAVTFKSMTIAPNQTVLIVTASGRQISDPDHFPNSRVVNLWSDRDHRAALDTKSAREQVFSAVGLYLELSDAGGNVVDEFGNIDGIRRTRGQTPEWVFPMNDDDDRRSSLIRRYEKGTSEVVALGTVKEGWVLASDTNFADLIGQTYYGASDDFGSPGQRGGGPLPVSLSKFRPERMKDTGEIVVRWITESELNNAGFNILRSEKRDSGFTKVHFEAGKGTTSERQVYEWKDTTATKPNVVYYYQIQDVSLDGDVTTLRITHLRGNVTAAGKATTTWGEIKALQ